MWTNGKTKENKPILTQRKKILDENHTHGTQHSHLQSHNFM